MPVPDDRVRLNALGHGCPHAGVRRRHDGVRRRAARRCRPRDHAGSRRRHEHASAPAAAAGLQVAYGGLAADTQGVDWTELVGLAIAFIVLAVTFGAVLAAGVPLVTALAGVGLASSAILVLAAFVPVSSTAPLLATMLGLAVGIDYALLIVSRHRAQLAAGMDIRESIAVATATAGTAVVFAGLTVMIALVGLSAAGIPFLSVMGLGAAGAVLCALAVAVTLLPRSSRCSGVTSDRARGRAGSGPPTPIAPAAGGGSRPPPRGSPSSSWPAPS